MKLHTALLENLFGPIRLHVLKQEGALRMVHLFDENDISRTLGVVRFRNTTHPLIQEAHARILKGELLGKTLLAFDIPYTKTGICQYKVELPEWIRKDFMSDQKNTGANYSLITVEDQAQGKSFTYAELFEIIPPQILDLVPQPQNGHRPNDADCTDLLGYADIKIHCNKSQL